MATRHELIHIDFVANAGKANPVMKSLQVACDDARVAKEKLDKELANAKAAGAPAKVIADIEGRLKAQTKTWEALQKGMREYTKGIDTLSKGIKEFNQGTLDQMSAKFNKSVYNAAKLVQSTVETGSKYWNQLQRLMDATDRNVTRAKEDIVTMMQSLKDGSSVSTVQLTRAKEVLEDLSRLAVYNSEEWRNLKAQMNEVAQAVDMVAATERSLKGEIASEQDALRLSNALTQESINLRHADGEAAMQAAKKEREGIEATMKGLSDKKAQRSKELDDIRDEIELQEHLDEVIKKRDQKIADARSTKQDAEQKRDEADRTIKAYDDQKAKVGELKKQVDELTKEQGKEAKAAEKAAEKAEKHAEAVGKQQEKVSGLEKEVEKLEQDLDTLSKQPVKPTVDTSGVDDAKKKINQEPIKPKVDDSEVKALEARLKAIQDAIAEKRQQIEAESKKGAGSISQWEETLKRVQGSKDGRLTAMGLGDEKKQMDDLLDVANRFYEIIKKVKGVTEDKFIPAQAAEPIKQLAEYYQITEEEARKLIQTLERSDVVQKKFATMRFDEHTGFLAVEQKKGVDDQQIRIEAAQSYLEKAREREAGQTERINKLTGELNDLEKKEAEQKEKIAAASEKAAQAAEQQNEATEKKVKLSKKEQQEVEKLTQDNAALTSTIEALKKQRDALTASDEKGAEAAKKGAEAAKEEAQAMKMTAEEAKAALEEMRKMSTLKLKGDTGLEASNIEQAQQYLMGRIKAINPSGVGGGRFTLQGKNQIKDLIDAFKKDYGIGSDKEAREIVSRLVTGKNGGLIQRGVYDKEFGALQVTVDPEALKQRGARMLELTNISKGVTAATKEQTAADQAQEEEVKRLREAYRQEDETLRKRKEEYQKRLDKANAIGGPEEKDGKRTARGQALDDAETYRQRYVVKQDERTKAAWEEYQAVKSGTQATEANTKAKKDNVSVDQQKKQIDEQIAALEQQKAGNTERLTQLQEKGAKTAKKNAEATQEQTQAVKESADAEMTMEQLLKRREDLDSKLAAKKEQLRKAQEELEKMTKSETAAEKEQSDVTARLTQKQAEYNEELQKMGPMKEARDQATKDRRNAQRVINRSDETINTTMREVLPERKSEEEMTQMRKKAEDLQKEINDLTQAFDQNAQAITNLNRKETEAAIEMAQSENVSIEKVKQAIELLKKKIETEATDAKTMQERGDAINRLSERLTQMNAEVAKLSQPIADRLKVDDLGTLSETEIRQGIEAAKQLIQTYKSGSDEANQLAERIVKAEKHLKDTGIEAARTAQQQRESVELMESQLRNGANLTESALKAQVQYWQRLADDPKTAAEAVKQYTANMKEAQDLLDNSRESDIREKAGRLQNMDNYSVSEIREGIDAAKKMQDTFKLTDEEVKQLSEDIVAAETRISKISVETERAARKEAQTIADMREQLNLGTSLTESALKAQENYWRRLADQPGQAADKVKEYTANMKEAQDLQKDVAAARINTEGGEAFDFFKDEQQLENASAETIKKHADALKKWRDSLPQKDEAATIITINELLAKAGVLTKKAADDAMTYEQALHVLDVVIGKLKVTVESVESQVDRATSATRTAIGELDNEIDGVNAEMAELNQRMNTLSDKSTDLTPYVKSLNDANKLLHEQREERQEHADMYKKEADERTRNIVKLKEEIALIKQQREDTVSSLNARIQAAQNTLNQLNSLSPEERGTSVISEMIQTQIRTIKELQKQRFDIASKAEQRLTQMHEQLTAAYKADEEATAEATLVIEQFDKKIDETQRSMKDLSASIPGFDSGELGKYTAELTRLNDELRTQQQERERLVGTFDTARQKRAEGIEAMKQEIALIEKERDESIKAIDQQIQAQQEALATLQSLDPQTETFRQMAASIEQDIQRLQEQKTAVEQSAETKQKLADANERLKKAMEANVQATANEEAVIKGYDDKIKQLEKDIADYTQKLTAAKGSLDAKEYEQAEKQMGELQKRLASLTEQRKLYIEQLEREREEATRTAEAENARKLAGQENVSIDSIEKAIKVLEKFNKENNEPGGTKWEETEVYIGKLLKRLNELKAKSAELRGDFKEGIMSVETAKKIADEAGTRGFMRTAQEIQLATKALNEHRESLIKTIKQRREGGNATDKEEAELADLTKKLKDLKFEQDNLNMSQEKMRMLMKQPTEAVSLDELRGAIKRADGELKRMEGSLGNSKEYKAFAEQVKNAKNILKEMEGQAKATSSAWDKAWSRLKTYVGMYMGFNMLWNKMTGTADDLMTLSDKMGEVRKTTGFTADEVGRLSDSLAKLDTRTGLTGLMEYSALAGSIGLKTQEQVRGFTEAANMLAVSLPEMGNEASRTLMKIADATGDLEKNGGNVRETLERVGSTIIALRANSAAAAGPITDFVSRVGAVGAQAGISIDQIAALGATVDALGGRVEMSATALSRMIPAIRNNTFEVAKAIGMTEKELKNMSGMEQIVAVFRKLHDSVKQFDMTTEEGMNGAADAVENMLGRSVSMQETMKALNQQGARAGIVFGLLSQNVDKLEEQLHTASEAYEENIALMDEYNKMNDTTAAKWVRLKNTIEEWFVSDFWQRFLGGMLDLLRGLLDILSGKVGPVLNGIRIIILSLASAWMMFKLNLGGVILSMGGVLTKLKELGIVMKLAIGDMGRYIALQIALARAHDEEAKAAIRAKLATMGATKAMMANAVLAFAAAMVTLYLALREVWKEAHKVEEITGDMLSSIANEEEKVTKKTDRMFESVGNARVAVKDANEEVKKAEENLKKTKKALDEGKASTDDLEKAETDLKVAHEKVTTANNDHAASIRKLNQEYSPYLGYMLSEISTAAELANARELINAKLRETILLKQQEAAYGRVESEFGEERDKRQKSIYDLVSENVSDPEAAARMRKDIMNLVKQAKDGEETIVDVKKEWARIRKESGVSFSTTDYQDMESYIWRLVDTEKEIVNAKKIIDDNVAAEIKQARVGKGGTQQEVREQLDAIYNGDKGQNNGIFGLWAQYTRPDSKNRKQIAADLLQQMDAYEKQLAHSKNFYDLKNQDEEDSYKQLVSDSDKRMKYLRAKRDQLLKEAGDAYKPIQETETNGKITPTKTTNPYGDYDKVKSAYSEWNGNDLVARRKEMLERVKALANGADVQAVLSEDAKFISDAVRKNIKTTEQAIEWYNTERLKIQEALHAKHLTNTGDWLDPKAQRRASRVVRDEMKYYLDELDAYYTERKAKIQEAQNDEEISEAEARNRTIANEAEWRQRRAELQQLYAKKGAKVTQAEQQAIFNIISERTGETTTFIQRDIAQTVKFIEDVGKKSKAAMDRIYGNLDKDIEQDFLRQRNAIGQHMKAIQDIIDKERPFNGITKDLQTNLTTMGILTAHMSKERDEFMAKNADMTKFNEKQAQEAFKEMTFLLGEAENAYSTTAEEVMQRAAKAGLTAWVEEMKQNPQMQEGLMAQLRSTFDTIQDAIKKEASQLKKEAEIMWNNILMPDGETTMKQAFDKTISTLGIEQGRVSRANSLIGAGQASERVVDKLAIKQMQVQMSMQKAYYDLMRKRGLAQVEILNQQSKELEEQGKLEEAKRKSQDAQHVQMALNLATTKEQTELLKLEEELTAKVEESQNRLYTELKEWGNLLASSLQSIFEASNAGNADYYNERAKMDLTGKGGPGAGTYVVIDNAGTSDAQAHYEYLDERQALEREHEIEQQNAQAEAWKKMLDDLNMKMSDQITDWLNAAAQNEALDNNTNALNTLTGAVNGLAGAMTMQNINNAMQQKSENGREENTTIERIGYEDVNPVEVPPVTDTEQQTSPFLPGVTPGISWMLSEDQLADEQEQIDLRVQMQQEGIDKVSKAFDDHFHKQEQGSKNTDKQMVNSSQSTFAKMASAANMYGIAYQAMSNDNLDATQKFQMIALQTTGSMAMAGLEVLKAQMIADAASNTPGVLGKLWSQLGYWAAPVFAVFTGLLGGLMGLATSSITKSKSQIASVTGASVGAGRMATGMLTYGEGNVNEFTDPSTLTPGRQYNVDSADGKTYRARYMGKNAKTHITNGPEFHLVGEKGREAIIDAHTTRQLQMDDNGIWQSIQTLYNGGRLSHSSMRRRGRGVRAFADGNLDEFEEVESTLGGGDSGMSMEQVISLKESIDRQSDLLEDLRTNGIKATFDVYGKGGLVDSYDTGKKNVTRHGERY